MCSKRPRARNPFKGAMDPADQLCVMYFQFLKPPDKKMASVQFVLMVAQVFFAHTPILPPKKLGLPPTGPCFHFSSKFCAQGDLGPVWDGFGERGAGVELDPPQLSCQGPGYSLKLKKLITLTVKTPVHRKPIFRPAFQCSGSPCPTGVSAATTSTIK